MFYEISDRALTMKGVIRVAKKKPTVKIQLDVPTVDIELLMEYFETDNPEEALLKAIDWAALKTGVSQLSGTMKMEGFDERGSPK